MVKCSLKESLETIKDSRIDRCKKHSLVDILMIVFFGLLCGYKSIESIHLYAELSINVLKKYLVLANGIPSADTILRVLEKIDTEQLGKVFIEYARSVFGNRIKDGDVVAFDGKTECGSKYSPAWSCPLVPGKTFDCPDRSCNGYPRTHPSAVQFPCGPS